MSLKHNIKHLYVYVHTDSTAAFTPPLVPTVLRIVSDRDSYILEQDYKMVWKLNECNCSYCLTRAERFINNATLNYIRDIYKCEWRAQCFKIESFTGTAVRPRPVLTTLSSSPPHPRRPCPHLAPSLQVLSSSPSPNSFFSFPHHPRQQILNKI